MADVITRFKLETTQYDSKLRDASKSLADLTHQLSMAGKDFERFANNHVQTAASLGQVASGATNLKDKLKDLVGAYNTVARAYNSLTKEQQSGDFGNAMAASLQKLQQDITQTKNELYNIGEQSKGTGGIMDQLASKFTLNIDAMKLFKVGLQAAQGALSVAKDAFFNNEEQLDEWGRVVKSSQSLYEGFLNALNTGDISGYIDNIGNIVKAARDAYDALDALNTFNAFNQINVEKTRTGMTEAIVDYREGKSTKEAVKASGEAYKKELQERQRLERDAYLKAVAEMAAKRGVSAKDLTDALSGTYGHYQDLKNVQMTGVRETIVGSGLFARKGTELFPQNDRERLGEALRHLNDTELQSLQALGAQAERTGNEIAGVDRQLVRVLNGRLGTGGSGGKAPKPEEIPLAGSIADLNNQIKELRKAQDMATSPEAWREYDAQIKIVTNSIKELKGELPEPGSLTDLNNQIKELRDAQSNVTNTEEWQNFQAQIDAVANRIKELKGELGIEALRGMKGVSISDSIKPLTREDIIKRGDQRIKNFKTQDKPKQEAKLTDVMGQMNSGISSMVSGIEGLGIELPKGMKDVLGGIQTVTSILTGISTILTAIEAISAADTIIPFASGGVVKAASGYRVPGRTFSGDLVPARLNAGETVLNQAQAGVIANALQDRDFSGGSGMMQPYVDGESIFLGMNNTSKRMGRGEIVTTSTLRRLGLI